MELSIFVSSPDAELTIFARALKFEVAWKKFHELHAVFIFTNTYCGCLHSCLKQSILLLKKSGFIFVLFSTENAARSSSTTRNAVLLHDTVDDGYILQKFSDIFTMTRTWYTVLNKLFQKYLSLSNTINFLHACTYNILSMNHKLTAHFYCISN